jgi:hypothetical protein
MDLRQIQSSITPLVPGLEYGLRLGVALQFIYLELVRLKEIERKQGGHVAKVTNKKAAKKAAAKKSTKKSK